MKFSSVILLLFALVLALKPSGVVSGRGWTYPPEFEGARVETYKKTPQTDLKLWIFDPLNCGQVKSDQPSYFFSEVAGEAGVLPSLSISAVIL